MDWIDSRLFRPTAPSEQFLFKKDRRKKIKVDEEELEEEMLRESCTATPITIAALAATHITVARHTMTQPASNGLIKIPGPPSTPTRARRSRTNVTSDQEPGEGSISPYIQRSPSIKRSSPIQRSPSTKRSSPIQRSPSIKRSSPIQRSPSIKRSSPIQRSPSLQRSPSWRVHRKQVLPSYENVGLKQSSMTGLQVLALLAEQQTEVEAATISHVQEQFNKMNLMHDAAASPSESRNAESNDHWNRRDDDWEERRKSTISTLEALAESKDSGPRKRKHTYLKLLRLLRLLLSLAWRRKPRKEDKQVLVEAEVMPDISHPRDLGPRRTKLIRRASFKVKNHNDDPLAHARARTRSKVGRGQRVRGSLGRGCRYIGVGLANMTSVIPESSYVGPVCRDFDDQYITNDYI